MPSHMPGLLGCSLHDGSGSPMAWPVRPALARPWRGRLWLARGVAGTALRTLVLPVTSVCLPPGGDADLTPGFRDDLQKVRRAGERHAPPCS